MARKPAPGFVRRVGVRPYRPVCWISAEGQTERDYFSMNVFKEARAVVKFPRNIHPDRRNPAQVLKRFQKALKENDFRSGDEAWIIVDVDEWDDAELRALIEWQEADARHHVAVSNPKFELFLLMHFDRGNGCTTSAKVDSALKRYLPRYDKRLKAAQFGKREVCLAIENARMKRASCSTALPAPGMTDAHLLAARLLGD